MSSSRTSHFTIDCDALNDWSIAMQIENHFSNFQNAKTVEFLKERPFENRQHDFGAVVVFFLSQFYHSWHAECGLTTEQLAFVSFFSRYIYNLFFLCFIAASSYLCGIFQLHYNWWVSSAWTRKPSVKEEQKKTSPPLHKLDDA